MGTHARTERKSTDTSLAVERDKVDKALAKRGADVAAHTDEAVSDMRERADTVVERARSSADEALRRVGAEADERAIVDEERQRADRALQAERAHHDEKISLDREAQRRALLEGVDHERGRTDRDLTAEREIVDDAIGSRDVFLGMVSHEIRNMLNGLAMSASSLLRILAEEPVQSAIARDAQRVQRYTARMNRLVADLLDVSSIESGKLAVVAERHDAMGLLRETLDFFEPVAKSRGIRIATDVRAGSLLAQYDHERVLQVLANIVSNAIKYTPAGGRVDIVVDAVGNEVQFAVTDTGPGIAPEDLEQVFERFHRGTANTKPGLGLGLYIARCIVEAHHGRIWATSTLGHGSTFCFTLPAAQPSATAPSGPKNPD